MADQVGSYSLDKITVVPLGSDKPLVITDLVSEINLQSSIIDATNTLKVVVGDARSLLTDLPLVGGSRIYFTTIVDGVSIDYEYVIMRIAAIQNFDTYRTYVIEASSILAYQSLHLKDSASYSGPVSDIAYEIYQKYTPEKIGLWDGCDNAQSVIIPTWSPLIALHWLATRAVKESTLTRYRFFQDSKGKYNFYSPEAFIESQKETTEFVYRPDTSPTERSGQEIPNSATAKTAVLALRYHTAFDASLAMREGFFAGLNFNINVTEKTLNAVTYNYFDDFEKNKTSSYLDKESLYVNNEYFPGRYRVNIDGDFPDNNDIGPSQIKRSSITNYNQMISIQTRGNSDTEVGQIVKLSVPKPSPDGGRDSVYSGRYYVVAKRDLYQQDGYTTTFDLVSDATRNT